MVTNNIIHPIIVSFDFFNYICPNFLTRKQSNKKQYFLITLNDRFMTFRTKFLLYPLLASVCMGFAVAKNNTDITNQQLQQKKETQQLTKEDRMRKADQIFAFELFEKVFIDEANEENKDFMISPISLSMALSMTMNGTDGETNQAIRKTLKMNDFTEKELNAYYRNLKNYLLKSDPATKISIANSIWTNKFVPVKCGFKRVNKRNYDAEIKKVEFGNPETVRQINQWASDNTNGLIDNVIDKTNADDLIYLLNAIYFKGNWSTRFDVSNTMEAPFFYEPGKRVKVDMMQQLNKFDYNEDRNLQMIKLPYGNKSYSMIVLLPRKEQSLISIIASLQDANYWERLNAGLRQAEVDLSLPKFKTEYSKRLNGVLTDMGMGVMFSDRADFSKISKYPANLTFVKQDSYISTDESGTEAAAVTMVGRKSSLETERVTFRADRPFMYVIQENNTGSILFMGTVKNYQK